MYIISCVVFINISNDNRQMEVYNSMSA